MLDCIIDSLIDTLKLIPYLFLVFLILELIEHKINHKNEKYLVKTKKVGPLIGGVLGAFPQCGFSTMASNLFSSGVITMGTLISIFLATSDEMLPIMISEKTDIKILLYIIGFKVLVGIIVGFIVDYFYHKDLNTVKEIHSHCEDCNCEKNGIFKSSLFHTIKTALFILIVNVLLNCIIFYIGEDRLSQLLLNKNIFTYFISSLIGLIPNCASSVVLTELFLSNFISIGVLLAGLLTGSGLGILFLFKENKNRKENIMILLLIYFIGVIIGYIVDCIL